MIGRLILARIHRADNLIVEHTLVVVHIAGIIGMEAVQVLRQFRQVIGAAGLVQGGIGLFHTVLVNDVGTHRGNLRVGLTEHFSIAHAAHRIAVASLYHRPEVLSEVVVVGIAVAAEGAQGTCHHRNMLVGVTGADGIDIPGQRVEEGRTVEIVGGL